ncbi:hypothetical protein CYMTET_39226 [Cymbomonas tetramitiformis]|uniref:Uncharacterized protein n=1 Tax=Cymbomonas tetramitiformis TaxID=36881 RepID=A0AAE0CBN4_9CHLO|nr:hypothetical protein CYMTET_39226 [Cymbomonas tetramitiformis]
MANAWKERVEKENVQADKANAEAAIMRSDMDGSVASMGRSQASGGSKRSYTTQVLKGRLDELERELANEKSRREKVESDLAQLKK